MSTPYLLCFYVLVSLGCPISELFFLISSHFVAVSPCGVLQNPFHHSPSVARSSLILQAFMFLPYQPRSPSRALPLHPHFGNCSHVFCFMSCVHVPEPFHPSHDHRNRFHLVFTYPNHFILLMTIAIGSTLCSCTRTISSFS